MAKRPQNHVTRHMDSFLAGEDYKLEQLPVLDRHQLAQLEKLYPARCLSRSETAEDHLRYAGMVELVASLRQRADQSSTDGGDEPDPVLDGENAQTQ